MRAVSVPAAVLPFEKGLLQRAFVAESVFSSPITSGSRHARVTFLDACAFSAPFCHKDLRPDHALSSLPPIYFARRLVSCPDMHSQTPNSVSEYTDAHPPAAAVNLRVEEAWDGRGVEGLLAHPLGQLGARARAAPAVLLRPPRLARGSRPTDLPVCAALPCSLPVQRLRRRGGGGGDGRGARAGDGGLAFFARLRRAKIFARLRRAVGRASGRRCALELHSWYRFGVFSVCLQGASTASGGSDDDKKFLLHQSIDLDELYPTVPVSQIVTRRKYFFCELRM